MSTPYSSGRPSPILQAFGVAERRRPPPVVVRPRERTPSVTSGNSVFAPPASPVVTVAAQHSGSGSGSGQNSLPLVDFISRFRRRGLGGGSTGSSTSSREDFDDAARVSQDPKGRRRARKLIRGSAMRGGSAEHDLEPGEEEDEDDGITPTSPLLKNRFSTSSAPVFEEDEEADGPVPRREPPPYTGRRGGCTGGAAEPSSDSPKKKKMRRSSSGGGKLPKFLRAVTNALQGKERGAGRSPSPDYTEIVTISDGIAKIQKRKR